MLTLTILEAVQTSLFTSWLSLRDSEAKVHIHVGIARLLLGLSGDVAPAGKGVSLLRVHHGSGHRVYFIQRGSRIILLLCGSDAVRDIIKARELARAF